MAKDEPDEGEEKPKKGSMVSQLLAMVLVTALAIGGGWGFSQFVLGGATGGPDAAMADDDGNAAGDGEMSSKAGDGEKMQSEEDEAEDEEGIGGTLVTEVPLDPIVTNVAKPEDTWVRLEMAVLFQAQPEPDLVSSIHQDIFAYMHSLKLHEVAGASGYLHMRSDLRDIVRVRSDGLAKDVLIKVLLFE